MKAKRFKLTNLLQDLSAAISKAILLQPKLQRVALILIVNWWWYCDPLHWIDIKLYLSCSVSYRQEKINVQQFWLTRSDVMKVPLLTFPCRFLLLTPSQIAFCWNLQLTSWSASAETNIIKYLKHVVIYYFTLSVSYSRALCVNLSRFSTGCTWTEFHVAISNKNYAWISVYYHQSHWRATQTRLQYDSLLNCTHYLFFLSIQLTLKF